MRAFLAELAAMVDRVRLLSIACIVAGAVVLAVLMAGNPGIWIGDGGWIILIGLTVSSAYQVYENRQEAGRSDAGAWGLATAGGLVVAFATFGAVSVLLRAVVASTPLIADNPVPLAVLAWALISIGGIAWQRSPQRRSMAAALALSIGTIAAGVAALKSGSGPAPVAMIAILLGFGVFVATVGPGIQQRARARAAGTSEPAVARASAVREGRTGSPAAKPVPKQAPRGTHRNRRR